MVTKTRPRCFGHYILTTHILGAGSYGQVIEAIDTRNNERVAVKFAHPRHARALEKEAVILNRLTPHRHVLQIRERNPIWLENDEVCIVLELAKGGELFDYIMSSRERRLDPASAARLFVQLLSAVQFCHAHSVVHLDLKPENLLMDTHNNLLLCDFGLARVFSSGPDGRTVYAPFHIDQPVCYIAPEICRGDRFDGVPADIWSCGVILFVSMTGKFPFRGPVQSDKLYQRLLEGTYKYPDSIPYAAQDLLDLILVDDPLERPSIGEILKHRFLAGVPVPRMTHARSLAPQQQIALESLKQISPTGALAAPAVDGVTARLAAMQVSGGGAAQRVKRALVTDFSLFPAVGTPPVFHETVGCYTRFLVARSAALCLELLRKQFEAAGATLRQAAAFRLECELPSLHLAFVVQLFKLDLETLVVEMRRTSGDVIQWYNWYSDLRELLHSEPSVRDYISAPAARRAAVAAPPLGAAAAAASSSSDADAPPPPPPSLAVDIVGAPRPSAAPIVNLSSSCPF